MKKTNGKKVTVTLKTETQSKTAKLPNEKLVKAAEAKAAAEKAKADKAKADKADADAKAKKDKEAAEAKAAAEKAKADKAKADKAAADAKAKKATEPEPMPWWPKYLLILLGITVIGILAALGIGKIPTPQAQAAIAIPTGSTTECRPNSNPPATPAVWHWDVFQCEWIASATQAVPEVVETEPIKEPSATAEPAAAQKPAVPAVSTNWSSDLFLTPVECEKAFNDESSWIVCEPGVINDATTAWTVGQTKTTYYQNVPEGAFAYFSLGEGTITIDGVDINLPAEKGLNYLVVIRGRIDDTIVDNDLNMTAEVNDFVQGHAIWAYMPTGAYVSHGWFRQQLVASTTGGFTNCGATGCSKVRIVLFDIDSHFYQMFEVHAGALDTWVLVK